MGFQLPTFTGEFSGFFFHQRHPILNLAGPQPESLEDKAQQKKKKSCFSLGHWQQYPVFKLNGPPQKVQRKEVQGPSKLHPTNLPIFASSFLHQKSLFPKL